MFVFHSDAPSFLSSFAKKLMFDTFRNLSPLPKKYVFSTSVRMKAIITSPTSQAPLHPYSILERKESYFMPYFVFLLLYVTIGANNTEPCFFKMNRTSYVCFLFASYQPQFSVCVTFPRRGASCMITNF